MESKHSQANNRPKSMCQKIGEEDDEVITSQENLSVDLHRRRHAINITNNPGYRVGESLDSCYENLFINIFTEKPLYLILPR